MTYIWDFTNKNTYDNRLGHYKFKKQFEFIKENIVNRSLSGILDIAGGSGRFAIPLSNVCENIVVNDINEEALNLLMSRNSSVQTICGDFLNTEKFGSDYDLIICIEAFEYFENHELFFKKVSTLISDNGVLIITLVNTKSWRFFLRNFRSNKSNYNYLSTKKLNEILLRNQFEIVKAEGMNWIPLPLKYKGPFVTFFEKIESLFKLNHWISQSPWILYAIKKKNNHHARLYT